MARYSAFLGRKVEVHYRAGDICLPASGTFVADSGRSIFLEQRFDQRGTQKTFRWEVPYAYIIRIEELPPEPVGQILFSKSSLPRPQKQVRNQTTPRRKPPPREVRLPSSLSPQALSQPDFSPLRFDRFSQSATI